MGSRDKLGLGPFGCDMNEIHLHLKKRMEGVSELGSRKCVVFNLGSEAQFPFRGKLTR